MIKVKELTDLLGHLLNLSDNKYGGLPVSTFRSYLREFTDTLGLQHNKEWQKLCFQWNGNQAQEYLQLNPKELVEYNGMSIKDWKEEDIKRKDVLKALTAKFHPLTASTIKSNKKLRKHLKNIDILAQANDKRIYVYLYNNTGYRLLNLDWLQLMDDNGRTLKDILELNTFKDWHDHFLFPYYYLDRRDMSDINKITAKLRTIQGLPDYVNKYLTELTNWICRYVISNPKIEYRPKTNVKLSVDPDENDQFETYLKMKGIEIPKWKNSMQLEEHYHKSLLALDECLMAKYNNNLEKETI